MGYDLANYLKDIVVYLANATPVPTVEAKRRAQEQFLALTLLYAVDRGHAGGGLLQGLRNNARKVQSAFPSTLAKALAMVNDYSATAPVAQPTDRSKGVEFAQEASESTANRGRHKETLDGGTPTQQGEGKQRDKGGVTCHHCHIRDTTLMSVVTPPRSHTVMLLCT